MFQYCDIFVSNLQAPCNYLSVVPVLQFESKPSGISPLSEITTN